MAVAALQAVIVVVVSAAVHDLSVSSSAARPGERALYVVPRANGLNCFV
jgi:hypothetical protein